MITGKPMQPNEVETKAWAAVARHARALAIGESRNWVELKRRLKQVRFSPVFGEYNDGNVCVRLKDVCWRGIKNWDRDKYLDAMGEEMHRLADEVAQRCRNSTAASPPDLRG